MRRIVVILPATADDAEFRPGLGVSSRGWRQLGWDYWENVRIDTRWATTNAAEIRRHATIGRTRAGRHPGLRYLDRTPSLQVTRTVPIVFPTVVDPVGAGFVDSLARLGGNATGFLIFEYSLGGKWLELLSRSRPM